MAHLPQKKEGPEGVARSALELVANVQSDDETTGMEKGLLAQRENLLATSRARFEQEAARTIVGGRLHSAKNRTKRELRSGAKKVAAHLDTERAKGEQHPVYKRLLGKKTPATYLPADPAARRTALEALIAELTASETPPEVRKLMDGVVKAAAKEQTAGAAMATAEGKVKKAREKEDAQVLKTIAAARALVTNVQHKYSAEPARAREVLDWAEPVQKTPLQKQQEALKTAKEQLAKALEAASLVEKLRAQIAEHEAELARLQAAEAKKKQKKGRGTPPPGTGQGGPAAIPE